ncbi:MAG TPA: hypothetical protein VF440_02645 [Novosphingobium sp.]
MRSEPPFLAASPARTAKWRPGLGGAAQQTELFASAREAAGAAMALALARERLRQAGKPAGNWLWVQDAAALRASGRPYGPGLPADLRAGLIHVAARTPEDALFALEEGLRCRDLAFVLGEIAGNPKALGFTASRRLNLMVERCGVPLWLVRLDAARDPGSARMRWEVGPAPSPPPRWNPDAPGVPSWRADLFRARNHPPGQWTLRDDGHSLFAEPAAQPADHGDLAATAGDRPLAAS